MIPYKMGVTVTILLAAVFFSGCAVHSPMSEMLMFQEKKNI
jgi:outer membrane PBP1 activator LpoA protein